MFKIARTKVSDADIELAKKYFKQAADKFGHKTAAYYLKAINKNKKKLTSLFDAVQENNIDKIKILKDFGADLNRRSPTGGGTAMHLAVMLNFETMIKRLATLGANINKADDHGVVPIHIATQNMNFSLIKLLTTLGADIDQGDNDGRTPMHLDVLKGHITKNNKLIQLMSDLGADLKKESNDGTTPLGMATHLGNDAIKKLLNELIDKQ